MPDLSLHQIERDGSVPGDAESSSEMVQSILDMTSKLYVDSGFTPPWVGYLATREAEFVGACGFKGPPKDGCVEIAYFTLPGNEGRGIATAMAETLIDIATTADPNVVVTAQTLVERDASHRILEKLSFTPGDIVQHSDDGPVLDWRRDSRIDQ
jgi:RimJ/RimL family protein N-acetyltransferase